MEGYYGPGARVKREPSVELAELNRCTSQLLAVEDDRHDSRGLSELQRRHIRLQGRPDERTHRLPAAPLEWRGELRSHLRFESDGRTSGVRRDRQQVRRRRDVRVERVEADHRADLHQTTRGGDRFLAGLDAPREEPVAAEDVFLGGQHELPELRDDLDLRDGGISEREHVAAMELLALRVAPAGHLLRPLDFAAAHRQHQRERQQEAHAPVYSFGGTAADEEGGCDAQNCASDRATSSRASRSACARSASPTTCFIFWARYFSMSASMLSVIISPVVKAAYGCASGLLILGNAR